MSGGGDLFLCFKDGREICQINPSQTLMNLQYSVRVLFMFDSLSSISIWGLSVHFAKCLMVQFQFGVFQCTLPNV